jgi:HSP20 family protein
MLTRYRDPFKDVLDTFFDNPLFVGENSTKIVKGENDYQLYFAVPGLTKDDLSISTKDGFLTVSHKKESNDKNNLFVSSFKKTYQIPDDVDEKHISGKVENGVLLITLPKSEKKSSERFISLN